MTEERQLLVAFFVAGEPKPSGSFRAFMTRPKHGQPRPIITGANARTKLWQAAVAQEACASFMDTVCTAQPVALKICFYLDRPKGHFKTGRRAGELRESAPKVPTKKPDLTKLIRSTEDALTGIVFHDDSQVVSCTADKHYADGGQSVGAKIEVYEQKA